MEGIIDGEVDAVVRGRVHAAVVSGNLDVQMQEEDECAVENAKRTFAAETAARERQEKGDAGYEA